MEVLIPITFFMSVAAVLILRPISKKIGGLIESTAREKVQPQPVEDASQARVIAVLDHLVRRLDTMEERLDFTERLVGNRNPIERRQDAGLDPRLEARFDGRRQFAPRPADAAGFEKAPLAG